MGFEEEEESKVRKTKAWQYQKRKELRIRRGKQKWYKGIMKRWLRIRRGKRKLDSEEEEEEEKLIWWKWNKGIEDKSGLEEAWRKKKKN